LENGAISKFRVGLNYISCELPIGFLKTDTYSLNVDASFHMREWIIDPERAKEYSIGFSLVNSAFGTIHSTNSPIAPAIRWSLS
jgi:hypothetical protein